MITFIDPNHHLYQAGVRLGLEIGRAKGHSEEILAIAETMCANGFTDEQIMNVTNISKPELETVRHPNGRS